MCNKLSCLVVWLQGYLFTIYKKYKVSENQTKKAPSTVLYEWLCAVILQHNQCFIVSYFSFPYHHEHYDKIMKCSYKNKKKMPKNDVIKNS